MAKDLPDCDQLPFDRQMLEKYLDRQLGGRVKVLDVQDLGDGGARNGERLKEFGYGVPLLIVYDLNGTEGEMVLHTVSEDRFGHERRSDRARSLLLDYDVFNDLPRHVPALDVGAFTSSDDLLSLGRAGEFFLLTEYAEGCPYARDLQRIARLGKLEAVDESRAAALADYLARIHVRREPAGENPVLYRRRVRDLLGHGEGIMGMLDGYSADLAIAPPARLEEIEHRCLAWRWRIKDCHHRLSQIHGDFHPWNVLFREGDDFVVLDRSRGAWGEPADDLSAMTINYVFFSLCQGDNLEGAFLRLHDLFWSRYLAATGDDQVLTVIQPFYAWRALVLAHPLWYPDLACSVREKLLDLAEIVLSKDRFDPRQLHDWL